MKKALLLWFLPLALLFLPGCKKVTDPLLTGTWDLLSGDGAARLVVEENGGAFWNEETVKWQIPEAGHLELTHADRQKTAYQYTVDETYLILTADDGRTLRYVHPDRYPGSADEHLRLAGLWTDDGGRLTLYLDAAGSGTRYGWAGEADAGFDFAAADGRMRMTFQGDSGQWVQYAFAGDGSLQMEFEQAPDGGDPSRTLWKMADSARLSGEYAVLYSAPQQDGDQNIGFISFDGGGNCRIDDVYGGYQLFENNTVIINAKSVHLSLTVDLSVPSFLTLSETGLDHQVKAVLRDAPATDENALTAIAGIWSDESGDHLLQISPELGGRAIWGDYEGGASFRVVGEFLRVEPTDDPDGVFYLCFEKVGVVLYAGDSADYPAGYAAWVPLQKLY